jgi:hypothetical protein
VQFSLRGTMENPEERIRLTSLAKAAG